MTENYKKDANVRSHLQKIAYLVDEQLPDQWGFVLMAFPFNEPDGRLNYVAKCSREDGIKVVRTWLRKQHAPEDFGAHLEEKPSTGSNAMTAKKNIFYVKSDTAAILIDLDQITSIKVEHLSEGMSKVTILFNHSSMQEFFMRTSEVSGLITQWRQ